MQSLQPRQAVHAILTQVCVKAAQAILSSYQAMIPGPGHQECKSGRVVDNLAPHMLFWPSAARSTALPKPAYMKRPFECRLNEAVLAGIDVSLVCKKTRRSHLVEVKKEKAYCRKLPRDTASPQTSARVHNIVEKRSF